MITETKIQLAAQRTNYLKAGLDQAPVIVLLHGLGTRASFWLPVIPALVDFGFQVYAPDLPGFGYSDSATEIYTPLYMANFITEFIAVANLGSVIVVGHSMGGAMAASFAIDHPEKIEALVLVDAFGLSANAIPISTAILYKLSLPSLYYRLSRQSKNLVRPIIECNFHRPSRLSDKILEMAIHQNWLDGSPGRTQAVLGLAASLGFQPQRRKFRQDLYDSSRQFQFPIFVIWGQEDELIPVSSAHQIKSEMPEIELQIISDCGHVPSLEKTMEFNRILLQFLRGRV